MTKKVGQCLHPKVIKNAVNTMVSAGPTTYQHKRSNYYGIG